MNCLLASAFLLWGFAQAHGVIINHVIDPLTGDIIMNAKFDTGEIMSEAQVAVFSPSDPATPWLVAEADALGNFRFSPDGTLPGLWEVQIRKAGHGDILRLQLDENTMASLSESQANTTGFTLAQIILMSASVIWGFIGTAFYFAARQKTAKQNPTVLKEGLA